MISKGSLVRRLSDGHLSHLNLKYVSEFYPPADALCIVVSSPREKNLSAQLRHTVEGWVSLKRAIDVLHEGKVYYNCELRSFEEVKNDRRDL